jgi:hypothetical protein
MRVAPPGSTAVGADGGDDAAFDHDAPTKRITLHGVNGAAVDDERLRAESRGRVATLQRKQETYE